MRLEVEGVGFIGFRVYIGFIGASFLPADIPISSEVDFFFKVQGFRVYRVYIGFSVYRV